MALTITPVVVNPEAGSGAARGSLASLWATLNQITIGAAGDYVAGGVPLTPQQLGHSTGVVFGIVQLRTGTVTTGTAVNGVLDCTNPAAPKLKLNLATGEAAGAGVAGDVWDVLAFGY